MSLLPQLCVCVCAEAAVRGRASARPAGQSDPEEPSTGSAVSGCHAGSASGLGEELRTTMGRHERQTGIHHRAVEGLSSS